jgi:hypothetical protein
MLSQLGESDNPAATAPKSHHAGAFSPIDVVPALRVSFC